MNSISGSTSKVEWDNEIYNQKHGFVFQYGASLLIDLLKPSKSERILNLRCGTGDFTSQIGLLCNQEIGVDWEINCNRES